MAVDSRLAQDVWKDIGQAVTFVTLSFARVDAEVEREAFQEVAGRLPAILNSLYIRQPEANLKVAFGLSCEAWDYLYSQTDKPKELVPFEKLAGNGVEMPATGGDLFLHVRAANQAVVYEFVAQVMSFLAPHTTTLDETHGFRYFEGRAILGFIDGTEAPSEQDGCDYALVGDDDPDFTNGSYAFAQKWVHDMTAWEGLPTEDQEAAIGRKKFSDLELDDEKKLPNAHNVAAKVEEDGEELKIVRMNVPYSSPASGQTGTFFIGYSGRWAVTKAMLTQMLALGDRLFAFSTIVSGQLFFIPSRELLARMADGDFA